MALLGFSGFDQADSAVASDGSSPVDGMGASTLGIPQTGGNPSFAAQILSGVAGAITGVVSDTAQAFSGYPRQPLVIQTDSTFSASAFTPSFLFGIIPTSGSNGGNSAVGFGVRLRFQASKSATLVNAYIPVLSTYQYLNASVSASPAILTYNPSTGMLGLGSSTFPTVTMPVPLGTEIYVEMTTNGASATAPLLYINGTLFGTLSISSTNWHSYLGVGGMAFVTGASDYFRIAVGDIYCSTGIAPQGNVMVPYLEYDTVTTKNATVVPSTDTALQVLTDDDDDTYVSSSSTVGSIVASFTKVPDGFNYLPIAAASVFRINRNDALKSTTMALTQSTPSTTVSTALDISKTTASATSVVSAAIVNESKRSDVGSFTSTLTLPIS